jgi:hypothetical protein
MTNYPLLTATDDDCTLLLSPQITLLSVRVSSILIFLLLAGLGYCYC